MFWLKLLAIVAFFCACVFAFVVWMGRNVLPGNGESDQGRALHRRSKQPHPWRRKSDRKKTR